MSLTRHIRINTLLLALLLSDLTELAAAGEAIQLNIHRIRNWHAPDDSQLIIEDHKKRRYRVEFFRPCPGLNATGNLAFISRGGRSLDNFSSVVLPDGSRCLFHSLALLPPITPTDITGDSHPNNDSK